MSSSLAGRVSAPADAFSDHQTALKQRLLTLSPALPSSKPPATPIRTCALLTEYFPEAPRRSRLSTLALQTDPDSPPPNWWRLGPGGELDGRVTSAVGAVDRFAGALDTSRGQRKRNPRVPRPSLITSGVDDGACDDALATVEESAAIEDYKVGGPAVILLTSSLSSMVFDRAVREACVGARSLILKWSIISAIVTIALCGLHWLDGMCTRGREYIKPCIALLKLCSEPLRYWAYNSCLLFCWLSVAFILHWKVQQWVFSTMVFAHPQEVTEGAFDPGGSFCHSLWPNTGLGCQLSFTTI